MLNDLLWIVGGGLAVRAVNDRVNARPTPRTLTDEERSAEKVRLFKYMATQRSGRDFAWHQADPEGYWAAHGL